MFEADQASRNVQQIDWSVLSRQDREREKRVYELIDQKLLQTGNDYYRSAMIFQHGNDTLASAMAVRHMKRAIELDSTVNKWLLAAAIDRDLMRRNQPQIYGTQYVQTNGSAWKRYIMDTTQITDAQRRAYRVETLAEQVAKERSMNLELVSDYYAQVKSIPKTIAFIEAEHRKGLQSRYDVSENGVNSFAYALLSAHQTEDALQLFTLNTQLHPDAFNTYDSLGECLMMLGRKAEAIKAYRKSLELNPGNENARNLLKQNG